MMEQRFMQTIVRFAGDEAMASPGEDRALVYLQIAKTGRSGFTRYLKDHFRRHGSPAHAGYSRRSANRFARRQLHRGHFLYAEWAQQGGDAWLLTFLRDPVARILAQYEAHRQPTLAQQIDAETNPDVRHVLEFAQQASLEEYLLCDDPRLVAQLHDVQTRAVSSFPAPDHPQFLSSALENLEQAFLFFGIAEWYELSLRLFRAQLNSAQPYCSSTHRRLRTLRPPADLTPHARARIEELIPHDRQLYDRALQIFRRRCVRLVGTDLLPLRRTAYAA